MTWNVNTGSEDSLNALIEASTAMKTQADQELEFENELDTLRKQHADELAKKQQFNEEALHAKVEERFQAESDAIKKQLALERKNEIANIKTKDKAEKKAEIARINAKYKLEEIQRKKVLQKQLKEDEEQIKKTAKIKEREENKAKIKERNSKLFGSGVKLGERKKALKEAFTDENGNFDAKTGFANLTNSLTEAMSDFAKQLDSEIESIASKKSTIDTRLQGSKNTTWAGSYWDKMSKDITGAAAISPYVKQSDIATQVETMVGKGIAFNVEERAFLAAIKDKIAGTFDATSATLTRLVRIQQQDTTAGRLGMESALTSFLNNMYETTEYMEGVASSIQSSIEEASALMGATNAVEFEYQVQKWMGSLYSVGMNQDSVTSLANALGKIAAGDISGINSDSGKLLLQAANMSGLSVSDMLAEGLDDSKVNTLMNSVVEYLAQIAGETSDSLVVQQQLANVYGLKASDLKAAVNLSSSLSDVSSNGLSYSGAMNQLYNMANTMYQRTSLGEMMSNAWSNARYTMAAGIANSPTMYGIYKVAGLLDSVAGGIDLPDIKYLGTGVNLQTSVADLMRVGALSGGILSSLGSIVAAGGNGGVTGSGLLSAFGVGNTTTVSRGTGGGLITANGATVSSSGYVGNSSSGDVISKTTGDANADANSTLVSAQEDSTEVTNKTIDEHIVNIYNILNDCVLGTSVLHVAMSNYGLVNSGGLN